MPWLQLERTSWWSVQSFLLNTLGMSSDTHTDTTFLLPTLAQLIICTHKYKRECPRYYNNYSIVLPICTLNILHWMQVSRWFHSPTALPWFLLDTRLGRLYSWSKPTGKRKLSALTGNQS
jgi:hypothetical protein